VTPRASDPRFATQQVLQAEARILSLADRGRRGGYGRVPLPDLMPHARALPLDGGQYKAVLELAGGGDFLSVLTAPAGAGKTRTLGAAAAAWEQAGYRVVGLAPSARAAAELADATGGHADTLAKWLHTRDRLIQLPAGAHERTWAGLDDRTVLIVDEASMASTLDLDRLTTAAAEHAAKVVLVGDPAQIGVVNGPGGMLAALVHTGHASSLDRIHRFTQAWEREASLGLRTGDRTVLAAYQAEGRLHACPDSDTALDGVFKHWTQSRQAGQDALMLARTRVDVDALNTRARTAAVADGHITGPTVTAGDGKEWQAGDLLRTRRNNRSLPLGDSHVRNGDRLRVLGPGPDSTAGEQGLIVEDLAGRGRTVLPADYLAEYCEYGWASTIDAAQGATADVGIVLVRPGMDREHLYVAMTRGRHGNHAYLTPDPTSDDEHDHGHGRPPVRPVPTGADVTARGQEATREEQARRVLEAALATSGTQDAAHTALTTARAAAVTAARQAATIKAAQDAVTRARQSEAARTPTPAHTTDLQRLRMLQQQREQLTRQHQDTARAARQTRAELEGSPRWARTRRRDLTATLTQYDEQRQQQPGQLAQLDAEISQVRNRLEVHDREWNARRATQPPPPTPRRTAAVPDALGTLTSPSRPPPRPPPGPAPGRPDGPRGGRPVRPWILGPVPRAGHPLPGRTAQARRRGRDATVVAAADRPRLRPTTAAEDNDLVTGPGTPSSLHSTPQTCTTQDNTQRTSTDESAPPAVDLDGRRPALQVRERVGSTKQRLPQEPQTTRRDPCCSPLTTPPSASAPPPASSAACAPSDGSPSSSSASTSASTARTSTPTSRPAGRSPTTGPRDSGRGQ